MDVVLDRGSSPVHSTAMPQRRRWDAFAEDIYRAWLHREHRRADATGGEQIDESLALIRMWWRV